jgi:hypothetical protein
MVTTRENLVDDVAGCHVGITVAHHEIHEGHSFHATISSADMTAGNIGFRFKTPNTTKQIHIVITAATEADGQLNFTEESVAATAGTAYVPLNRKRSSPNTTDCTGFASGAVTSGGGTPVTLIDKGWGTPGPGVTAEGGGERGINEWDLAPNTDYLVILSGTTASGGWLEMDWYEHTPPS